MLYYFFVAIFILIRENAAELKKPMFKTCFLHFKFLKIQLKSKVKTPIFKTCFLSVGRFDKDEYSIAVLDNLLIFSSCKIQGTCILTVHRSPLRFLVLCGVMLFPMSYRAIRGLGEGPSI